MRRFFCGVRGAVMHRFVSIPAVLLALILCSSAAVRSAFSQAAEGTVTGHVYCDDTNGPARMAHVMLRPVSDVSDALEQAKRGGRAASQPVAAPVQPTSNVVQTGLDGGFTIKGVSPGAYYLIVDMPGYLSSLSRLSEGDWEHPTASTADRMVKMLQRVSVEAGRTAVVNLTLERGASVSGTVNFDDGSPAVAFISRLWGERAMGAGTVFDFRRSPLSTIGQRRMTWVNTGFPV